MEEHLCWSRGAGLSPIRISDTAVAACSAAAVASYNGNTGEEPVGDGGRSGRG